MAKSYRTAFIRITSENEVKCISEESEKKFVVFKKEEIEKILKDWSESAKITYWFIEHTADAEISKTHYHVVIKFGTPVPFESIKSKFPYGDIQSARNIKNAVQYLIHMNDSSKKQYEWEDIKTNCEDMTPYKMQSKSQQEITIENILEKIDKGIIREYNITSEIPIGIFARHRTKIENGLIYYRERVCMDKNREINVVFVSGDTGIGKTSFAKSYCEMTQKSCCVSSSSNDPMQDYKGEDVLILDDLRDSDFKFTDMLKILDNHTKSTVRSRYHNKAFIGDTIIITSYKPLNDWYFDVPRDSKEQLYRRIKTQYQLNQDKINAFEYDEQKHRYNKVGSAPNLFSMKAREKANFALNMLSSMGIELEHDYKEKIIKEIEEKSDSELEKIFITVENDSENPFIQKQ